MVTVIPHNGPTATVAQIHASVLTD